VGIFHLEEKRNTHHMQRIFGKANGADALIQAAPENQPYRNESEIKKLFVRLAIPVRQLETSASCHMVRI